MRAARMTTLWLPLLWLGCGAAPPPPPSMEAPPPAPASSATSSDGDAPAPEGTSAPAASVGSTAPTEPPSPAPAASPVTSGAEVITERPPVPRPGPPTMRIGEPVVGDLDRTPILRVVRRRYGRLRTCYNDALGRDMLPRSGRMVIVFRVEPTGKVSQAAVAESIMDDSTFETCVLAQFRTMEFPESAVGFRVYYPIDFRPDDG